MPVYPRSPTRAIVRAAREQFKDPPPEATEDVCIEAEKRAESSTATRLCAANKRAGHADSIYSTGNRGINKLEAKEVRVVRFATNSRS